MVSARLRNASLSIAKGVFKPPPSDAVALVFGAAFDAFWSAILWNPNTMLELKGYAQFNRIAKPFLMNGCL